MSVPQKILDLVETFQRNVEAYRAPEFNEANLRQQFVNPMFKALGWDMDNEQGYAEAYKDVIHEASLKIGGETKAPDYCFRIGGTGKFYLEAKKPAVNLYEDPAPAFQLRRYAWSAKMPLSILTNFDEFAVYDCRVKPAQTDKASAARILYLTHADFAKDWAQIADVFAREAILKGAFDKLAESKKGKKGTATVDAAFLAEMEQWREDLAKNFALRNPQLALRELNFAVQITIDRIVFLRMCEDRGIEPYGQLRDLAGGDDIYEQLAILFRRADQRYNSGLFHFDKERERSEAPDSLTLDLTLDDKVLRSILTGLYYPNSPYEFSVIPVEILGQVYEQFLGKVIRLTASHQAKVEEKPEVKKAGGVYYTPKYIVDYIVQHTVGKLLGAYPSPDRVGGVDTPLTNVRGSEMTPTAASKLRILDPACGSGSFLLGAYQYLIDWHLKKYQEDGPDKHKTEMFQGAGGVWRLTTAQKKRILLNNIYGVDIDPQAVEVTKLSLLLKVLEGESQETIDTQLKMFHERALPDLASNIKCGNSLIGPDFYDGQQLDMFDEEDRYRINVFDWNSAFPAIMKAGGFNAVIGNPPWGQKEIAADQGIKDYIWNRYPSSKGIYDLFRPFVEKGIDLSRQGGMFGMVLPDIVLLKDYMATRLLLLDRLTIKQIDWWGMAFAAAVIDAATICGLKDPQQNGHMVHVSVRNPETPMEQLISQDDFRANPRYVFNLHLTPAKRAIVQELNLCPRLGDFFAIHEGVHSGNIRDELFVNKRVDKTCKPLIFGRDEIHPYHLHWAGKYIRFSALPDRKTRERYANAGNRSWYEQDKVLVRRTGDFVLAAIDRERRYASNNFFIVFPKQTCDLTLDGLCALLNSTFMTWYFRTIEPRQGRVFAELKIKHLETFPLPDFRKARQRHDRLVALVEQMLKLHQQLAAAKTPHDQTVLQTQIAATDRQIDQLVYELYGLTEEEIKIVEEATA